MKVEGTMARIPNGEHEFRRRNIEKQELISEMLRIMGNKSEGDSKTINQLLEKMKGLSDGENGFSNKIKNFKDLYGKSSESKGKFMETIEKMYDQMIRYMNLIYTYKNKEFDVSERLKGLLDILEKSTINKKTKIIETKKIGLAGKIGLAKLENIESYEFGKFKDEDYTLENMEKMVEHFKEIYDYLSKDNEFKNFSDKMKNMDEFMTNFKDEKIIPEDFEKNLKELSELRDKRDELGTDFFKKIKEVYEKLTKIMNDSCTNKIKDDACKGVVHDLINVLKESVIKIIEVNKTVNVAVGNMVTGETLHTETRHIKSFSINKKYLKPDFVSKNMEEVVEHAITISKILQKIKNKPEFQDELKRVRNDLQKLTDGIGKALNIPKTGDEFNKARIKIMVKSLRYVLDWVNYHENDIAGDQNEHHAGVDDILKESFKIKRGDEDQELFSEEGVGEEGVGVKKWIFGEFVGNDDEHGDEQIDKMLEDMLNENILNLGSIDTDLHKLMVNLASFYDKGYVNNNTKDYYDKLKNNNLKVNNVRIKSLENGSKDNIKLANLSYILDTEIKDIVNILRFYVEESDESLDKIDTFINELRDNDLVEKYKKGDFIVVNENSMDIFKLREYVTGLIKKYNEEYLNKMVGENIIKNKFPKVTEDDINVYNIIRDLNNILIDVDAVDINQEYDALNEGEPAVVNEQDEHAQLEGLANENVYKNIQSKLKKYIDNNNNHYKKYISDIKELIHDDHDYELYMKNRDNSKIEDNIVTLITTENRRMNEVLGKVLTIMNMKFNNVNLNVMNDDNDDDVDVIIGGVEEQNQGI